MEIFGALGHLAHLCTLRQQAQVSHGLGSYPPARADLLHALRSPKRHEMPTLRLLNCSRDITQLEISSTAICALHKQGGWLSRLISGAGQVPPEEDESRS